MDYNYRFTYTNFLNMDQETAYGDEIVCPICLGELKQNTEYRYYCNNCQLEIEIEEIK
jgi:hypothetical protein